MQKISDLADCTVAAWVMERLNWRFVFDSSDGEWVVQHELFGVTQWHTSGLNGSIGVMEIRLEPAPDGNVAYMIETVCAETIEVVCADVRETIIKHRVNRG